MKKRKSRATKPINLKPAIWFACAVVIVGIAANLLRPSEALPRLAAHTTLSQVRDGDYKQINEEDPGNQIKISRFEVFGKYTIFDFESEFCPACQGIKPLLKEWTKFRPDIAVRSIDINRPGVQGIDWDSPVCKQYGVHSAPNFKIYGPTGRLISEGQSASALIRKCIQKEIVDE